MCGSADGKYKCPKCREPYCSVKCCREHKEKCPVLLAAAAAGAAESAAGADDDADNNQNTDTHMPPKKKNASKYLPSDALTADPLENAVKRRRMLDDASDQDSSDDEGPGWRLNREMMDRIDQSAWLRAELADGGLRQLICQIDGADEISAAAQGSYHKKRNHHNRNRFADKGKVQMTPRELALEKARRTNPNFGRFVDRMLLSAGILATPDGSGGGGDPGAEGGGSGVSLEALLAGEEEAVGEMRNVQLVPVARPRPQLASETLKPSAGRGDVKAEDGDDSSSSSGDDGSSSEDDSSSEGEVEESVT